MPTFRYKAIVPNGKTLEGEMEATSEAKVVDRLQGLGYIPIETQQLDKSSLDTGVPIVSSRRQISMRQFEMITRRLARLVAAGVRLERGFQILIETAETPATRRFLIKTLEQLRGGATLAQALTAMGPPIQRLHVCMVEAGESAGLLHITLEHLSDYLATSRALRRDLTNALSYPLLVLTVSVVAVGLLMTLVVPQFSRLFEGETQIPAVTRIVIDGSDWFKSSWDRILIVFAAAAMLLILALRLPSFRRFMDRQILNSLIIGPLVCKAQVARFSRLLATLLANGVNLNTALPIVANSLTNAEMASSIQSVIESVRGGSGFANGLERAKSFPPLAVQLVRVGEETAQLDSVLSELANLYEEDVAHSIKVFLRIFEPALIVLLGGMIGTIIIAIYLGILSINDIIQ